MRKLHILVLVLGFIACAGCTKYLSKKRDASLVSPTNLYDLQAILDNSEQTSHISPSFSEASSDEFYLTTDLYNSFRLTQQCVYTWRDFVAPVNSTNDWSDNYYAIYNNNLTLDIIKSIPRNQKNAVDWDNVKGSALFFRAYHFLNLVWQYGKAYDQSTAAKDLGIVLRNTSNFNVPSTRASVQACYNKILEDTKAAISYLPTYPFILTRPSKGAAYGLLARAYLSMRDYKNALLYADSALRINDHLIDFNGDADIEGESLAVDYPFKQYNKETIFYCEMSTQYDYYSRHAFVDTLIINLYETNDLRKIAYYRGDNDRQLIFKGNYTGITYNFSGIATDEIYLIRAECYIREGDVESGLDDINTLLEKRYKTGTYNPLTGLSSKDALIRVLEERRKELIFRGNRWIDIKRLNKEGANIVLKRTVGGVEYTLNPGDPLYALPLPDDIIAITGMSQN